MRLQIFPEIRLAEGPSGLNSPRRANYETNNGRQTSRIMWNNSSEQNRAAYPSAWLFWNNCDIVDVPSLEQIETITVKTELQNYVSSQNGCRDA